MTDRRQASKPPNLILLGAWFGLVTSMGELGILAILKFGLHRFLYYIAPQTIWMLPLGNVILFAVLGTVLTTMRWIRPSIVTTARAVLAFAFLGFTALAYYGDAYVHDAALVILSLGCVVTVYRWYEVHPERLSSLLHRTSPAMVGLVLIGSIVAEGGASLRERRAVAALGDASPSSPNILLIILDTVRAQDLSAYGYERPTTPFLTRIAGGGVRFERAMSTAPWTLPSHGSIFTGRLPSDLGVNLRTPLDETYPTLAEALSDRGYITAGFVANFSLAGRESGLARGFTHYEDFPRSLGQVFANTRLGRLFSQTGWIRDATGLYAVLGAKPAELVSAKFLRWRERNSQRPFFAFLNYFDAHAPYLPKEPYAARFGSPRPHGQSPLLVTRMHDATDWSKESLAAERAAYDGEIAFVDDQLRRLFSELGQAGVLDHTLVIISSDHGEEFGEHHLLGHGELLYSTLTHVPLIFSFPGRIPDGRTVTTPVSLRNIPSTVMDLVEHGEDWGRSHAQAHGGFPGRSMAELWHSPAGDSLAEPVISQQGQLRSVVLGAHHYIVDASGHEELYDLSADPYELDDLGLDPAARSLLPPLREALARSVAVGSR